MMLFRFVCIDSQLDDGIDIMVETSDEKFSQVLFIKPTHTIADLKKAIILDIHGKAKTNKKGQARSKDN